MTMWLRSQKPFHQASAVDRSVAPAASATTDVPAGKLGRKAYEAELARLQGELVAMQEWVKRTGAKVCVVFEGRDTAGKVGTIKRITERVSPREGRPRMPDQGELLGSRDAAEVEAFGAQLPSRAEAKNASRAARDLRRPAASLLGTPVSRCRRARDAGQAASRRSQTSVTPTQDPNAIARTAAGGCAGRLRGRSEAGGLLTRSLLMLAGRLKRMEPGRSAALPSSSLAVVHRHVQEG